MIRKNHYSKENPLVKGRQAHPPICNRSVIQSRQKSRQGIKRELEAGEGGQLILDRGDLAPSLVDDGHRGVAMANRGKMTGANGLFEEFDGGHLDHVLGEIGAELQGEGADESRVVHRKRLDGEDCSEGPVPECGFAGWLGMIIEGWW